VIPCLGPTWRLAKETIRTPRGDRPRRRERNVFERGSPGLRAPGGVEAPVDATRSVAGDRRAAGRGLQRPSSSRVGGAGRVAIAAAAQPEA
jgi:hypothetical protein